MSVARRVTIEVWLAVLLAAAALVLVLCPTASLASGGGAGGAAKTKCAAGEHATDGYCCKDSEEWDSARGKCACVDARVCGPPPNIKAIPSGLPTEYIEIEALF